MIKISLIGATGNVGRSVAEMLLSKKIVTKANLHLFASTKSVGQILYVNDELLEVKDAAKADFTQCRICICNTESEVSERYVPMALQAGAYVVDSSSQYRLVDNVPLIVPPVNKSLINLSDKLYTHANCLASPIAATIAPLHKHNKILHVNAVTYQSTSGAGKRASDECWNETSAMINGKSYTRQYFKRQIAFNVIPQVGEIMDNGMTYEEFKIINELKKVVDNGINITATTVRVPVMVGHSIALSLQFTKTIEPTEVEEILNEAPSVNCMRKDYMTPIEVVDKDDVFVGRIRKDYSAQNGIHLWLCSDYLRRGAATDSVEIVEEIVKMLS